MLMNGGAVFSTFLVLRFPPCASLCVQKRRTHTDASKCVAVCVLLCVEGNGSTCSVGFDAMVFGSGSITHTKNTRINAHGPLRKPSEWHEPLAHTHTHTCKHANATDLEKDSFKNKGKEKWGKNTLLRWATYFGILVVKRRRKQDLRHTGL